MSDRSADVVGRRDLVAVFDESGASSRPGEGEGDDFALSGIVLVGRRAWNDLVALDSRLIAILGTEDYKYRQVRQSTEARAAVLDALDRQSAQIRVFGFYAAGGALIANARRELKAVEAFGGDVERARTVLSEMTARPREKGLEDAILKAVPAVVAWAGIHGRSIDVYFDQRTDLHEIAQHVIGHCRRMETVPLWGDTYTLLRWRGACPTAHDPVARIADCFAGDLRATFHGRGGRVWSLLKEHGFVKMHEQAQLSKDALWSGPIPLPKVGFIPHVEWACDWRTGDTRTTMFGGYSKHLLTSKLTLMSPAGQGCFLARTPDGFNVHQMMD